MRDFVEEELLIQVPGEGNENGQWWINNTNIVQVGGLGNPDFLTTGANVSILKPLTCNPEFKHRLTYAYVYTDLGAANYGGLECIIDFSFKGESVFRSPINFVNTGGGLDARAADPATRSISCGPLWGGNAEPQSRSLTLRKPHKQPFVIMEEPNVIVMQPLITDFACDKIDLQFVRMYSSFFPLCSRFYLLTITP